MKYFFGMRFNLRKIVKLLTFTVVTFYGHVIYFEILALVNLKLLNLY